MSEEIKKIVSYKGFDADMKCRGFQYVAGEEYAHEGEVEACAAGFHACEYPLDVLRYYSPNTSRFFVVEQSGTLARHGDDSKIASSKIKIGVELNLAGLIKAAVEYTFSRAKPIDPKSPAYSTAENGLATASGDSGAATASGDSGAATASGYSGAATASGYSGAATASGNRGAATASGYSGAATASGRHSAAMASGFDGRARGIDGAALFLVYRDADVDGYDYGRIIHAKALIVGRDSVKADTWYSLNAEGEVIEA
ncbi:hypothetical protein BLA17378_08619 [Burkholderia aenigmatica]|uniref:DUF7666 domain-containing protein n=1 Tax=Burkholderia aenigmatica TaxID=2015348 RepID=A0ABY6Y7G0_9BURK|nr:hypothetical protein [Burkholderia aenigmatica]VWD49581.1 hypothetical protein BLA17378_08619 [Burkholderia aenigmatica]